MAYDSDRGVVVLFGGSIANGTRLADTWEWNGNSNQWNLVATPPADCAAAGYPCPRDQAAMAYDSVQHRMVMFGGFDQNGIFSGTWAWDGQRWTALSSSSAAGLRRGASMAFDAERNQLVLFGGATSTVNQTRDTFVWDWTTMSWIARNTTPGLNARRAAGMCYDPERRVVVMFGGKAGNASDATTVQFNDTWVWDGSQWSAPGIALSPVARSYFGMDYDARSKRPLLFGGTTGTTTPQDLADTWTWLAARWCDLSANQPGARGAHSIVFDAQRGEMVLFGGSQSGGGGNPSGVLGDTWTLRTYCRADFQCDGFVNSQDFFDFLSSFFQQQTRADFNCDGFINSQDFFDFLAAFFAGCP